MGLNLVESFLSIQGEGASSGKLAIFLRFAGCNLTCKGFGVSKISPKTGEALTGCDTIRAVYTSHFKYQNLTSQEILSIIKKYDKNLHQKPIVVITGGEPLLHYKNEDFINLVQNLLNENYEVHFETNGTIEVNFSKFELYKNCTFAISVKLSASGETKAKRINKAALKAIKNSAKQSFYKFVINDELIQSRQAADEIFEILEICENDVFCMPQGYDKISLEKNARSVAEFCINFGFNYTDRVHIRLWGDKDGV
ncbi:7-carboxy-7-deazaguanine synthase QueE [Campylobacter sp. RM16192]|uniref:7-carboxy-7-deazaguanine synthase QueE n=1 Tax=Campylobacter sp. RM16192 TaxID=1660080 RepID=UPI001452A2C3|nr:7-carboxy-7-deazaguanine synthase QueE [Campylobacter sp. RM16192]QCD53316.1 7-carboxy-7-deazaguanine synthase [Campylobacter sp. RM16192]